MALQLRPGLDGTQGVLRAGFPLTRLELSKCRLLDGAEELAAALMQLPHLRHLSVDTVRDAYERFVFPADVLSHLVKLTCLLLQGMRIHNSSSDPSAALQPLQALTGLADLQLRTVCGVTADTVSGADQLTRLFLEGAPFEPRLLAGKAQLQHLTLSHCSFVPGADAAQLLSELQHLTQLTHLGLQASCWRASIWGGPSPLPAAYASLTASSRLQHLDFRQNTLPSAAWQYMCPPGRTLPQLQYLDISRVREALSDTSAWGISASLSPPDTSALVRCCPGLQILKSSIRCSTAQLTSLQQLTGLQCLAVGAGQVDDLEGVQALCQLTGLWALDLFVFPIQADSGFEARILQVTRLTRLTSLNVCDESGIPHDLVQMGELHPVWCQLLEFVEEVVESPYGDVESALPE